jgi:hypothetical protein
MQPITVHSQLDFKTIYKINLYLLYRKRIMWWYGFLVFIMIGGLIYRLINNDYSDYSSFWFGGFFILYYLMMPLLIYSITRRNFKKIKSTSEPKIYFFDNDNLRLESETINFTSTWSPIERVRERSSDFLLSTANGRAVHYLPKNGFEGEAGIFGFKELIRNKGIKNNFK